MENVPDFAAVNETVNAAKETPNPRVAKVVNGVLRNIIRQRETISLGRELETFPTVLVRRWSDRFGVDEAEKLAAWHNLPAITFLARRDRSFVELERGKKVADVEGYAEGAFIVQDPGTALAVGLLAPQAGELVLDACAAPGGKTVQIAWRGAKVVACEVNPNRRKRLIENLSRLSLEVEIVGNFEEARLISCAYDKVLVDAPCSNTGVFRRRPDARWNWSEEKLAQLVSLQAEILEASAALVKKGGALVYSTCSNEPEENLRQIEAFLARHSDFELSASEESVPTRTGHDGAFAARIVRKA